MYFAICGRNYMQKVKSKDLLIELVRAKQEFVIADTSRILGLEVVKDWKAKEAHLLRQMTATHNIAPSVMYEGTDSWYLFLELERELDSETSSDVYEGIYEYFSKYIVKPYKHQVFRERIGKIFVTPYALGNNLINLFETEGVKREFKNSIRGFEIIEGSKPPIEPKSVGESLTEPLNNTEEATVEEAKQVYKAEDTICIKYERFARKCKPTNFGAVQKGLETVEALPITFKNLANVIKRGSTFLLGGYHDPKGSHNNHDNLKHMSALGLDIDFDEKKEAEGKQRITRTEFIKLLKDDLGIEPVIHYNTFSDTDNTSFRVVYRFARPLGVEEYKTLYRGLLVKYGAYLDEKVTNPNRLWAGTKHEVYYNSSDSPITEEILKEIKSFIPQRVEPKQKVTARKPNIPVKSYGNGGRLTEAQILKYPSQLQPYLRDRYFAKRELTIIRDHVNREIPIKEILERVGAEFVDYGEYWASACVLHSGDNPKGLLVYKPNSRTHPNDLNLAKCQTGCNRTYNVWMIAQELYGITDNAQLALLLIEDYNIKSKDLGFEIGKEIKFLKNKGGY